MPKTNRVMTPLMYKRDEMRAAQDASAKRDRELKSDKTETTKQALKRIEKKINQILDHLTLY